MTSSLHLNRGPNGATALSTPASPINPNAGSASFIPLLRSLRTASSSRTHVRSTAFYLRVRLSMAISSSRLRRKMVRRRFGNHTRPRECPIAGRSPSRLSPNPPLPKHGDCHRGQKPRWRLGSAQRGLASLGACGGRRRACDTTASQCSVSRRRGAIRPPHRALCVPTASRRDARGPEQNVTYRPELVSPWPLTPDPML